MQEYTYTKQIVRIDEMNIETGAFRTRFLTVPEWRQFLIESGDYDSDSPAAQRYHDFMYAMDGKKWLDPADVKLWYIDVCEGYLTRILPWPDQESTALGSAEHLIQYLIEDAREWLSRTVRNRRRDAERIRRMQEVEG